MLSESKTIPKNSSSVEGPCVLPGESGIPRFRNVEIMLVRLTWQAALSSPCADFGSNIRKSSSKWQT